ncbi:cell polarity protein [Grosmannia clavigera kw1407]|uniref:Cell polarity protein n=1 Tax=Grosmannia clavigera (strain kw1407 / UAMH 11150) TaxID=655863 RepID=F0XT23_GROCL|nr:cell polarity protein [Grosmannia clavigera kw1407]EFW99081.1 cell polarity protein [Grosmannia clavigera kw1407]
MNGRNAPLSPVSLGDSDWPSSYPMDKDDPYANSRGQLTSPPNSGGPGPGQMNGFSAGPRNGGPSPPPSIGRSSIGRSSTATNLYAPSEGGQSAREIEMTEAQLGEHYVALRRFLSQTSRDGKPANPANKARDKLQRLTSVQFLELSTDVYDELVRRQTFSRRPPNAPPGSGPPTYLLPEDNFHPKRNQARQKLASLGPPRFRDLATDVFCELERRFPRFVDGEIPRLGSPTSIRGSSRAGTPMGGGGMNGFPPRGQGRRRPSEADSVRSLRGPGPLGPGGPMGSVPPSPGLPPNGYDRPMQKQSQTNTIVPNKSTMVEEDDDATSPLDTSKADEEAEEAENEKKRMIDDYESQLKELREKVETMELDMKQQKEEADAALEEERTRASASTEESQESSDVRRDLETRLAEAEGLAESLQQDVDRMRNDHEAQEQQLRAQIDDLQASLAERPELEAGSAGGGAGDSELAQENEELRQALREQQEVTEEVRRDAEQFLQEMRILSQQSGATYEKHAELEKTIETLEAEVIEWRNRYARAKTQMRSMRASTMGLPRNDAGKYIREQGFTASNGLVKDVHVTKFQIAVDELLHHAHVDGPEQTVDAMKAVVVSVRRITKDVVGGAGQQDVEVVQLYSKLRGRVSATANNLITATKNFSISAGLSPVSLIDAAASNLVAAVVELLQTVKIRPTPTDELEEEEEEEDGTITPVDSSGFFSPRSNDGPNSATTVSSATTQDSLPPPPPFQGLGGYRNSTDSSAYSPVNSPRESSSQYAGNFPVMNKGLGTNGLNDVADRRAEELKAFLDDQTATMVQIIQEMVGSIRGDAPVQQITDQINEIADIVGKVIGETEASGHGGQGLDKLVDCRQRLLEAGDQGDEMMNDTTGQQMDWRSWTTSLPPIAFEIARETKELVKRVDRIVLGEGAEDFS